MLWFLKIYSLPSPLQLLDSCILVPVILSTQHPFVQPILLYTPMSLFFSNSCHTLSFSALILMFSPKIAPSQDLGIEHGSHSVHVQWW